MKKNNFASVKDFRAKLSYANIKDPQVTKDSSLLSTLLRLSSRWLRDILVQVLRYLDFYINKHFISGLLLISTKTLSHLSVSSGQWSVGRRTAKSWLFFWHCTNVIGPSTLRQSLSRFIGAQCNAPTGLYPWLLMNRKQ
jgi:hypothetical protein